MFYKAKAKQQNTSEKEKNGLIQQITCQGKYGYYE